MNSKYKITGILFLLLVIAACKKESVNLKPSDLDKDWFVVKDNPSDPLDHLIYTVYQSTGVPVFYKDTIGSENKGTDVYGKPVIYYETLKPFYTLKDTLAGARVVNAHDESNLILGVKLIRDRILPLLKKNAYPKSFYLADTIWISSYATANVYRGLKTTVIGQVNTMGTMSDNTLTSLAGSIAGGEIGSYLVSNDPGDLAKFYAISNNIANTNMYSKYEGAFATPPATANGEEFGFITVTLYSPMNYTTPTQADDVASYIVAIKTRLEADFKTQYADFPYVLQKYDFMKSLLTTQKL